MKNIAYQSDLFQILRETNHTEYRYLCERLNFVYRILSMTAWNLNSPNIGKYCHGAGISWSNMSFGVFAA